MSRSKRSAPVRLAASLLALGLSALQNGCATNRPHPTSRSSSSAPSTSPASAKAHVPLDWIQPPVTLAATQPSTQPSLPPLAALELFARSRDAELTNQRYTAITQLEKAIQLDPQSVELNLALGRAYLLAGGSPDRAMSAFERARQLDPQNLDADVELARVYQARSDSKSAIDRLRAARLTNAYQSDDPLAAVVDYRLGVALQQEGYDRAAIDCYQSLITRLQHGPSDVRSIPEINFLLARPQPLYEEMAKLYEDLGDEASALSAYQTVADQSQSDFELQARVVRTLAKMHRQAQAEQTSADLVRRFHASADSLALLREVYHDTTGAVFLRTLSKLHNQDPHDRSLLFAYADTLASQDKSADARQLLDHAVADYQGDVEVVERAWKLEIARNGLLNAATLLISASAHFPANASSYQALFLDLLSSARSRPLRVPQLQQLQVDSSEETARQYWVAQAAQLFARTVLFDTSIEKAATASKPFDPAARQYLLQVILGETTDQRTIAQANSYIEKVGQAGRRDLSMELAGLLKLQQSDFGGAIAALEAAAKMQPNSSPDLQEELALAYLRSGNGPRFESLMWALISDSPRFDLAYQLLNTYYVQINAPAQAGEVIEKWLAANPNSADARLAEIDSLSDQRRFDEASTQMLRLLQQEPDSIKVIYGVIKFFNRVGQPEECVRLLEQQRSAHPDNVQILEVLTQLYADDNKSDVALRDLNAARGAVGKNVDLLYYLAHLYQHINQNDVAENVLEQVLAIDPRDPQAGNDLGYTWADQGKNLDRAEKYIRLAVDAEPDNPSYLDSLGWVLYKRGQFEDAHKQLDQATKPAASADPVVLDHLGDTLYRLKKTKDAVAAWQQSLKRIQTLQELRSLRDDMKDLPTRLNGKITQTQAGSPASVAPTGEAGTTSSNPPTLGLTAKTLYDGNDEK